MIADDHEDMLQTLVMILRKEFEIVGAVENGRSLVEAGIASHPDIIVSDLWMPLLTGPQARQELMARGYPIPFVFVSAATESFRGEDVSLVDKLDISEELTAAILTTALGQVYVSQGATRARTLSYH